MRFAIERTAESARPGSGHLDRESRPIDEAAALDIDPLPTMISAAVVDRERLRCCWQALGKRLWQASGKRKRARGGHEWMYDILEHEVPLPFPRAEGVAESILRPHDTGYDASRFGLDVPDFTTTRSNTPMERRRHASAISTLLLGATLIAMAALTAACEENPVGRECFIGLDAGTPTQAIVASPALECQSRTCLRVPQERIQLPEDSEYTNLCTAECNSDGDCDRVPESPCQTGFTCAVPVVVGPFCCRKLCVCKDYLVLPDGGPLAVPEACNADNTENTCCNLPGRGELPECQ